MACPQVAVLRSVQPASGKRVDPHPMITVFLAYDVVGYNLRPLPPPMITVESSQ